MDITQDATWTSPRKWLCATRSYFRIKNSTEVIAMKSSCEKDIGSTVPDFNTAWLPLLFFHFFLFQLGAGLFIFVSIRPYRTCGCVITIKRILYLIKVNIYFSGISMEKNNVLCKFTPKTLPFSTQQGITTWINLGVLVNNHLFPSFYLIWIFEVPSCLIIIYTIGR